MAENTGKPNEEQEVTYYWLAKEAGVSTTFAYNLREQGKFTRLESGKLLRSEAEAWIDGRARDWELTLNLDIRASRRQVGVLVNQISLAMSAIDPESVLSAVPEAIWKLANDLWFGAKPWEEVPADETDDHTTNKGDSMDEIDRNLDLIEQEIKKRKPQPSEDEAVRSGVDALIEAPMSQDPSFGGPRRGGGHDRDGPPEGKLLLGHTPPADGRESLG
jgi:hypothetical protein